MLLLCLAAVPRLTGLACGVPDHVDSREALVSDQALAWAHGEPLTVFNWPGTPWFVALGCVARTLEATGLRQFERQRPGEFVPYARGVQVLCGLLTVALVVFLGTRWGGIEAGWWAAAMLAVAMLHATNEGRFALVDVPVGLLLLVAVACLPGGTVDLDRTRPSRWLLAGALGGLAVATKYTAGIVVGAVLVAAWRLTWRQRLTAVGLWLGGALVGFTLGCPYWLGDLLSPTWNEFFNDLRFERTHYQFGHFGLVPVAAQTLGRRLARLPVMLSWGVGLPQAVVWVSAWLTGRRWPRGTAVVTLALLTTLLPAVCFPRHLVLVYPLWAVLAGVQAARWTARQARVRLLLGFVVGCSAVHTAFFADVYRQPPTPQQAADWFAEHPGRVTAGPPMGANWLIPAVAETTVDWTDFDYAVLPDRLVTLFESWSDAPSRYGPTAWFPALDVVPSEVLAFQHKVQADWLPVARFRSRPGVGRWRWPLTAAPPPFGWLSHPDLTIYARPNSP